MAAPVEHARTSGSVTLDTDAISPDSLKAAFALVVDRLTQASSRSGIALDWNTAEMAQGRRGEETDIVVRVAVLP